MSHQSSFTTVRTRNLTGLVCMSLNGRRIGFGLSASISNASNKLPATGSRARNDTTNAGGLGSILGGAASAGPAVAAGCGPAPSGKVAVMVVIDRGSGAVQQRCVTVDAGKTGMDALFAASRHWGIALHFNKGLAGAPADEVTAARDTAINPAALAVAQQFRLDAHDVVYVDPVPLVKWNRVVSLILPSTQAASNTGQAVNNLSDVRDRNRNR